MAVTVKSQDEINRMRDAGKILAEVHEKLEEIIKPGITTLEIDRKGEEFIRNAGCIPSFKGYEGYPASICVSINDEVVDMEFRQMSMFCLKEILSVWMQV